MELVNKIKDRVPNVSITTDIIVGFPGETEEDFIESAEMCKTIGFSHIHTFKYSIRIILMSFFKYFPKSVPFDSGLYDFISL